MSRHESRSIVAVFTFIWSILSTSVVVAQDVPVSADPGQIEQSVQPVIELAVPPPLSLPPRPTITRPKNADQYEFVLSSVELIDAKTISSEELQNIYNDRIGSAVTLAVIYDMADELTALYRNRGYVLSQAVVPAQKIESGSVRIQIVEGFIHSTEINGIDEGDAKTIRRFTEEFTGQKPLKIESFERGLLLINDLPGINASGIVGKSKEGGLGAAQVRLMTQFDAWSGTVSLNNRGSRQLGPGRLQVTGTRNFIAANHIQIGASGITTLDGSELNLISGYVESGLPDRASRIRVSTSIVAAQPNLTLDNFNDLETDSFSIAARYTNPLTRTRLRNLYIVAGAEYRSSTSLGQQVGDVFGTDTQTKYTELSAGLRIDRVDQNANINQAELTYFQGLSGFGASDRRAQGESPDLSYSKFEGNFSRLQVLPGGFSLLAAVQGQISLTDNLPASESYSIGGQSFLRAYDSSERSGDSGAAIKLELRFNRFFKGIAFNPYGYFDAGLVDGETDDDSLVAIGAGVRFSQRSLGGYVEVGVPVDSKVTAEGDDDPRVFGGVSYSF